MSSDRTLASRTHRFDVAVIVVNHNTRDDLLACLDSVPAAAAGLDVQLTVVDNASRDGSVAAVRERFPRTEVIVRETNVGFARACNLAAVRARANFLAFVNPDVICRPDSLRLLVEELRRHPELAAVGPRLTRGDGSFQASAYRFPTAVTECAGSLGAASWLPVERLRAAATRRRWLARSGHFDPHDERRSVDFVTGACLVVRTSAFEAINGFDERFFLYYEEIDLCRRLREVGWEIVHVPDSMALHHINRSGRERPALAFLARQQSRLLYHDKHARLPARAGIRAAVATSAVTALLRRLWNEDPVRPRHYLRVLGWVCRPGSVAHGAAGLEAVLGGYPAPGAE